jgi:hypothetical protein
MVFCVVPHTIKPINLDSCNSVRSTGTYGYRIHDSP